MIGAVGVVAAAAAVTAATVHTPTTAGMASAAATAVSSPPLSPSAGETAVVLSLAARVLDVLSIGDTTYNLVWQTNGSTCPKTFSMGGGAPIAGVPSATARMFAGETISEGGNECVNGGLLAVPSDTFRSERTMARLGESGVADRLTSNEWSAKIVEWAAVIGLRANSWKCSGFARWPESTVAYFNDASWTIRSASGSATTLPAGQRHLLFANTVKLFCIMSAPAAVRATGGDDTPKGVVIGASLAAVVAVAAAAATGTVVWRRRRRAAAAAGGGAGGPGQHGGDGVPPLPPPPPPNPPSFAPGVDAYPGTNGPWAPWQPSPQGAHPTFPPAAAVPPTSGKEASPKVASGGWAPPPQSLGSSLTMTPPGVGWDAGAIEGGAPSGGGGDGGWGGDAAGRWDAGRGKGGKGDGGGGGGGGTGGGDDDKHGGDGGVGWPGEPVTPPPMPHELRSVC